MRHCERNYFVVLATWIVLLFLHTQASPVKRGNRLIREVYPEIEPEKEGNQAQVCIVGDVVYGMDEPVPSEQPCLKCRCQPPGVQCETTRCVKKPGCRAIHKPNKCCPDYQCECEHEGKIYGNGERLATSPGGECKVCYCRGGEVQCAEVTCYIRTDCEGRTVPGQCCPKYDNCPPKEPFFDRTPLTTETALKITNQNETKTYDEVNKIPDDKEIADKSTQTDFTVEPDLIPDIPDEESQVVVHEIIPEVKLIPVTPTPETEINEETQGQLIIEETTEAKNQIARQNNSGAVENINDLLLADSDLESSELSEVYHQPPPVLRIGDKLLFLKKGELIPEKDVSTPIPVITIIGAEGLQRGFEESGEIHEISISDIDESLQGVVTSQTNDLDASGMESTHVFSLVKFNSTDDINTTEVSGENDTQETTTSSEQSTNSTDFVNNNVTAVEPEETSTISSAESTESTTETTQQSEASSQKTINDEVIVLVEQNPAYPPFPDAFSPINTEPELAQIKANPQSATGFVLPSDELKSTAKILPDVLEIRNNKTIPENVTNMEWLKNESLINENAALPDEILKHSVIDDYDESTTSTSVTETTSQTPQFGSIIEQVYTPHVALLAEEPKATDGGAVNFSTSRETIEDITSESSRELTTAKNKPSSIMSNENASVDVPKNASPEVASTSDLVEIIPGLQESTEESENKSAEIQDDEATTQSIPSDVELIEARTVTTEGKRNTTLSQSEEVARTGGSYGGKDVRKPERLIEAPTKISNKPENNRNNLDDDKAVFQQLDEELNTSPKIFTKEEENNEAEKIFKELLEEVNTTPQPDMPAEARNKETEVLQRVSDAIAKFQLRDTKQSLDSSILGILREFFSSQYKYYDKK